MFDRESIIHKLNTLSRHWISIWTNGKYILIYLFEINIIIYLTFVVKE